MAIAGDWATVLCERGGGAVAVVVAGAVDGGWEWRCGKGEEMTDLLLMELC